MRFAGLLICRSVCSWAASLQSLMFPGLQFGLVEPFGAFSPDQCDENLFGIVRAAAESVKDTTVRGFRSSLSFPPPPGVCL
jgi:hypothetical protein